MRLSEQGLNFIAAWEQYRGFPYLDAVGIPTVGFGHVIRPGEDFTNGVTEDQARGILLADAAKAERSVCRLITVPLEQWQYDALVDFTFNAGGGALQSSRLRACVNREEHDDVPEEFLRWVYAGGRQLKGLVRRRKAEAILYAGGNP